MTLFGYYAIPALTESDDISVLMGRTSLLIIPAVLIATWRRNVLATSALPLTGNRPSTDSLPEALTVSDSHSGLRTVHPVDLQ